MNAFKMKKRKLKTENNKLHKKKKSNIDYLLFKSYNKMSEKSLIIFYEQCRQIIDENFKMLKRSSPVLFRN